MSARVRNAQVLQHSHHAAASELAGDLLKRLLDVDPSIEVLGARDSEVIALAGQHLVQIPVAARDENERDVALEQILPVEPVVKVAEHLAEHCLVVDHVLRDPRQIGAERRQLPVERWTHI